MLHALITIIGTGTSRDVAIDRVLSAGGDEIDDGARLIWAVPDGLPELSAMSRLCPEVTFGVEAFEEFGDELMRLVVVDGTATELSRTPLLDDALIGPPGDEDGDRIEPPELRRAGRMILYREPVAPDHDEAPLAVALAMAANLGRFADRVSRGSDDVAPTLDTLQAVADLGDVAVSLCIGSAHACGAEREHHRAMALSRAVLHAGRECIEDGPWDEWLGDLLADGARVVMAAYEAGRCQQDGCRCHEILGFAAIPLLTLCIQVLATFQPTNARLADA